MTGDPSSRAVVHASCVALGSRALLIRGKAGAGKSSLALDLLSRGASLVSDDRTEITRTGEGLRVAAPAPIRGRIEARGLGLLNAPVATDGAILIAVVDLDTPETERLPPARETELLGITLPILRASPMTCFPAALILYLGHGRTE
ncbi:HPr kinase/phosphatase C-terminal domain-containing protein [Roseovarius sp. SCSIO 43702]|uniref:HPr kinase/phosphorylase n=1 Tax=Roseovarius sp. SCSIO 43702 TaxID=2823043 RepID=UPI001C73C797|nr:HPr kinase/phosphatase C-terminal domain-containing protein [Roseovarius sp. SCSIO 43702]QYX55819.1 HPr kinase/phosphatase C-terminal domain-containing protein [Roseovarius sp. SCSIO 43702]